MLKITRGVLLSGLLIVSLEPYATALSSQKSRQVISNPSYGCACPCGPGTATFRIWQQKDGHPDRFAVNAVRRWLHGLTRVFAERESSSTAKTPRTRMTELLILLGRSPRGAWSLEAYEGDPDGIYANLVCTTTDGKRKVFLLLKQLDISEKLFKRVAADGLKDPDVFGDLKRHPQVLRSVESSVASYVSQRLRRLATSGQWDADALVPVDLPPPSEFPALVFRPRGAPESSMDWTLSLRTKDRRLLSITKGGSYFHGAKSFGGVRDDSNGQIWWILIKTAYADSCGTEWHSIRLNQR